MNIENINIDKLNSKEFAELYEYLEKCDALFKKVKDKLKQKICERGKYAGYSIKEISGGKELNAMIGFDLLVKKSPHYLSEKEFFKNCTLSVNSIEKTYINVQIEKNNCNKSTAIAEFNKITKEFIKDKTPRQIIIKL